MKRAKRIHSTKIGRACPTVNDAEIRGYRIRAEDDDDAVTCATCRSLLTRGARNADRLREKNERRAKGRKDERPEP